MGSSQRPQDSPDTSPTPNNPAQPPRRSSLGLLLRRSKSTEFRGGSKKQIAAREREAKEERDKLAAAVPRSPPRLPQYGEIAPIESFGGEDRPDSVAIISGQTQGRASMEPPRANTFNGTVPPVPPIPNGSQYDPYARTESMTHRGRYSYASSAVSTINSPRRVRRRKDPTPFK